MQPPPPFLEFPKETPCVQVFGPRKNLLPDALGGIIFANELTVFQDLVLKKGRRLSEDDQIDIPPEPVGEIRFQSYSLAAGDCLFCYDRQVQIAAPASPSCHRRSEQIDGRNLFPSPEYGGEVLHLRAIPILFGA